jgi:hypothetical protein
VASEAGAFRDLGDDESLVAQVLRKDGCEITDQAAFL